MKNPYLCKHRIVIFGGHDDFVKKIKKYFIKIKINQYMPKLPPSYFNNIDYVFIQNRACCHSMFDSIMTQVRKNGRVKVFYFSQSSAKKCAEEIIIIDNMENKL